MKILLAIDDSKFSKAATSAVIRLAPPRQAQVRILHVVEPPSVLVARGMSGYSPNLRMVWEEQRRNAQSLVSKVAKQLRRKGYAPTTSVVQGEPRGKIVDVASRWKADMIVIGSHGHRGLKRLLLGSVSDAVVHHAHCSVLVVRINRGR